MTDKIEQAEKLMTMARETMLAIVHYIDQTHEAYQMDEVRKAANEAGKAAARILATIHANE